jgi:hypothetical protein
VSDSRGQPQVDRSVAYQALLRDLLGLVGTTSPTTDDKGIRSAWRHVPPEQEPRLIEIRDNLTDRITEAEREGWLGRRRA